MTTDMDHYRAAARAVPVRSLSFTCALGAFLASRSPILGFDLILGGIVGFFYAKLVMRANERLLDGGESSRARATRGLVRIASAGAIPVFTMILGPWWAMFVYYAGFFTPHLLFALDVRRRWAGAPRD